MRNSKIAALVTVACLAVVGVAPAHAQLETQLICDDADAQTSVTDMQVAYSDRIGQMLDVVYGMAKILADAGLMDQAWTTSGNIAGVVSAIDEALKENIDQLTEAQFDQLKNLYDRGESLTKEVECWEKRLRDAGYFEPIPWSWPSLNLPERRG